MSLFIKPTIERPAIVPRPFLLIIQTLPNPLYKLMPGYVLGTEWWDEQRNAACQKTRWHCAACGIHSHVEFFRRHLMGDTIFRRDDAKKRFIFEEIVGLCYPCYLYRHRGHLLAKRHISAKMEQRVVKKVEAMLIKAGVTLDPQAPIEDLDQWKMVVGIPGYKERIKELQAVGQ